MQWFYAINGERHGPISPDHLAGLIAQGTVTDDTLVWREGLGNWEPWGKVAAENPLPEPSGELPPPPVYTEPTAAGGAESAQWTLQEFSGNLAQRGFSTSVGGCLARAWSNYKSFFGLALGSVLVAYLVLMVSGMIPVLGVFTGLLLGPHINAGMAWIFLKRARDERVEFGDVFEGLKRCYLKLLLVGLVQMGFVLTVMIVFVVPIMLMGVPLGVSGMESETPPDISLTAAMTIVVLTATMAAVLVYFSIRFLLTGIVAIDRPESAIDAYRLSWRITRGRFWTILGLMIVLVLAGLAGALALLIGLIFVMPFFGAVIAQLYHDAIESAAGRPPE